MLQPDIFNAVDFLTSEEMRGPVKTAFSVGALLLLVLLGTIALRRIVARYIQDPTGRYRARKAVSAVGYLFAIIGIASMFSDSFGRLSVLFGVAGAGIAFALQEVIASVAGWVALSFGGYYKVGDRIQLGGIKGDVIDIGLLRTTLVEVGEWVHGDLYNGRVVRVTNSFVFKEPVFNYSGDFPFLWDEIEVPARHGSNIEHMHEILATTAHEVCSAYEQEAASVWKQIQTRYPLENAQTAPMITLRFDQNWITFTLRYAVAYNRRRATKHQLSHAILQAMERSGQSVQVATSAVELSFGGQQPLRVTMQPHADTSNKDAT